MHVPHEPATPVQARGHQQTAMQRRERGKQRTAQLDIMLCAQLIAETKGIGFNILNGDRCLACGVSFDKPAHVSDPNNPIT
jgi:hypothetical protein